MAVYFPSIDACRLALTSGTVPPRVSLAPVAAAFTEGAVWVEPSVSLPRNATDELRRLGAEFRREGQPATLDDFQCWPQLVPLERADGSAGLTSQTPVLFEIRPPTRLPEIASEILRLGNDRQGFRWLGDEAALLRVLGPPYYTLLRALEGDLDLRGYVERAPGIWVQLGFAHALALHLKPAEGQILLLRPPRDWTTLTAAPFRDIYEILEFSLPTQPVRWHDAEPTTRLNVPIRLAPATSIDAAELWVLRDRGFEQIDELVRTADDGLVSRLAFAVAEDNGRTTVALRVRPSRLEPPVLVLLGANFRPYLKLPNLFVPCGSGLRPPLRRDAVRKLLADDPDRVTWLYPTGDGGFTPESLPDSSFRPLADWVDYVLHHEKIALQQWTEATTFDFEPFVCKEDLPDAAARAKQPRAEESTPIARAELPPIKKGKKSRVVPAEGFAELKVASPSELQKRLQELEQRFLGLDGPIDHPDRQALWPELARVNATLGHAADAGLCWLQALWTATDQAGDWARAWSHGENIENVGHLLEKPASTASEVRGIAAWLTARGLGEIPTATLKAVRHFLETHEALLPVRAVWLAAVAAFHLSDGDVLGLTRTRDRLLERLYQKGLAHDQDLPSFLRFSGVSHSQRLRAFRDWLLALPEQVAHWAHQDNTVSDPDPRDTIAYGHLMLAFGLARLGEETAARRLLGQAEAWLAEVVVEHKDVHLALKDAFGYRIQQALDGKPALGPLPQEILEFAEQLEHIPRYITDSLRARSRILEPQEKINAFRNSFMGVLTDFDKALKRLPDILDRTRLEQECRRLLKEAKNATQRFQAVKEVLAVSPRLGADFAAPLLQEAPAVCTDAIDAVEQAKLLERAMFLAAHFNQGETVRVLLARFHDLLHSDKLAANPKELDALIGQSFRGLRKLGMQDEMRGLLQGLTAMLTRGKPLAGLRKSDNWPRLVRHLLHVASGHFYFGNETEGRELLEEARQVLLQGTLQGREQAELACTYIATLGQAPIELALAAIDELFQRLRGVFDNYASHTHYSASKLEVIETIVLTIVTEEFAMGQVGRRWLEDDEYLVRKRIHRDVEVALGTAATRA